ncbi:MAG: hypothetical protein P4M13_10610 [Alphaproteobacteria bacterium]|nr:hypothetical protein [Alphaproteobacteria bacterium]
MFPSDSPPPLQYRHKKPAPVTKKESSHWVKKALAWAFIIGGLIFIVAVVALDPKQKSLVCNGSLSGRNSLITFGSCTRE